MPLATMLVAPRAWPNTATSMAITSAMFAKILKLDQVLNVLSLVSSLRGSILNQGTMTLFIIHSVASRKPSTSLHKIHPRGPALFSQETLVLLSPPPPGGSGAKSSLMLGRDPLASLTSSQLVSSVRSEEHTSELQSQS